MRLTDQRVLLDEPWCDEDERRDRIAETPRDEREAPTGPDRIARPLGASVTHAVSFRLRRVLLGARRADADHLAATIARALRHDQAPGALLRQLRRLGLGERVLNDVVGSIASGALDVAAGYRSPGRGEAKRREGERLRVWAERLEDAARAERVARATEQLRRAG